MPHVEFINENAVLIKCEFVPKTGATEIEQANALAAICQEKCGYWIDAANKNERRKKMGKDFKLLCFANDSPYLPYILEQLQKHGDIPMQQPK